VHMRITIFGATEGIGRCLVDQALARGDIVTAAVRDPALLPIAHERLCASRCDVLDAAAVAAAVDGQEAVLCAIGSGVGKPTTVYSAGTRNIIAAMGDQGARRLVMVSNFCLLSETPRDLVGKAMLFLGEDLLEECSLRPRAGARGGAQEPS
jgi:putative NADH-flavin reductase